VPRHLFAAVGIDVAMAPAGGNDMASRWTIAALLLVAAIRPAPVLGQTAEEPTRDKMVDAARDAKSAATSAPERSAVERALYWYDNQYVLAKIFDGWHGFHFAGGGFPAGAGTTYGVGFRHAFGADAVTQGPNALNIESTAASSTLGYRRVSAALGIQRLGGAPIDVRVQGGYSDLPQEDFFGIGQDSLRGDRTDYRLENTEAGVDVQWRPATLITVGSGVSVMSPRVGAGTDTRFPSIEQRFDTSSIAGATAQPDFVRTDASIGFDWRENPLHPHAGGRYAVQFSNFQDRDQGSFDFRRVTVDLQQYLPLSTRYRLIALRAAAVVTDASPGHEVPFYFQPTLGGSNELRGFREFRFRDRNSLSLTAEYRWEAWWMLDGALFVDAGKVASDPQDLTLRDLDVSYGIGFRVHSNRAFVTRLDLARSREGFIPLLRFEHVF
jgi:hypothetical protein